MKAVRRLPQQATSRFTEHQIAKVLKFGVSYAESIPLKPVCGTPSEALKNADSAERKWMSDFAKLANLEIEAIESAIHADNWQIPHADNREGYCAGHDLLYWLTGYQDYLGISKLAADNGVAGGTFFDFGGSSGRVFRHFLAQSNAWNVWSCDFKQSSVDFSLAHFPSSAKVFLNNSYPVLPIPDSSFDLIAGCSVFTHINETETSWLLELRRTMKIGGLACLSIHNDQTWQQPPDVIKDQIRKLRPELADRLDIPPGKTVLTFRDDDPYNCNVFHSDAYIRQNWERFFEVVAIHPLFLGWAGKQAMVVLRRTD